LPSAVDGPKRTFFRRSYAARQLPKSAASKLSQRLHNFAQPSSDLSFLNVLILISSRYVTRDDEMNFRSSSHATSKLFSWVFGILGVPHPTSTKSGNGSGMFFSGLVTV
jgi:hypothetical protein